MLNEHLYGEHYTEYNIKMGGVWGIVVLTIGDVKIATLVGHCPDHFVKDCLSI